MESIFIQIAAYHDYELPKTILNAIEQASGEYKIHFGVHNSYYEPNHIHVPNITVVDTVKIRLLESQAPENIGVGASRSMANSLYDGEDYYFQIDSHSRLAKDWDINLVNCLKSYQDCGIKKPLITTYPASYYYDDCLMEVISNSYEVTNISFHEKPDFSDTMIPHQTAVGSNDKCSKSVSAGSIFTIGEFHKIAVNKKMAFWGEEILIAARAFTHGYDLLLPDKQNVFHLYYAHDKTFQHNLRRHVWSDWPQQHAEADAISRAEVKRILTEGVIGDQELGTDRTLEQFGEYAGLDFKTGTVLYPSPDPTKN